jgi:hypothetical protein
MFQQVRKHLNASTFIALLALVFAVTGGAFAASNHGGGSSGSKASVSTGARGVGGNPIAIAAKSRPKAKTGPRGPAGPKGAAGATGPAGAAGAKGENGAAGATGPQGPAGNNGEKGETGARGAAGTTVKSKEFLGTSEPAGEPCKKQGGSEFKAGTKVTYACNGEKGVIHQGETLAPEVSEYGAWSFGSIKETALFEAQVHVPVASFTIPLAAPLESTVCDENPIPATCRVHYINDKDQEVIKNEVTTFELEYLSPKPQCPGSAEKPEAAPGNFCVYASHEENVTTDSEKIFDPGNGSEGTGTTGAYEYFLVKTGAYGEGQGTWAVTAPAAP